ncbi:DUF6446 family protein [Palleronia sp. LCG004]|uniref:DUF6446 family protein n=1 Tax=Palleronia sp. LCG004 TaxID=3079304 RepID=UPI0029425A86|nr:DUF6446 family protein [Palleronia sp. LCG004]WOI57112.1 DUF6446 family protein [Palleronia sp. LCG004]
MTGKILVLLIAAIGIVAAISVWYLQVYYYYENVDEGRNSVQIVRPDSEAPALLRAEEYHAIDANSSPIRYRACFEIAQPNVPGGALDRAREDFTPYPGAEPLNAPFWFDCFDAAGIGAMLEEGRAAAFLGTKNFAYGVDRIVAITDDGRGYVWHQPNNCGELAYDGSPVGEECPPREDVN